MQSLKMSSSRHNEVVMRGILYPNINDQNTETNMEHRETLGNSAKVWRAMTETLRAGNDQLLVNKHHLLTKVWDLTILARNLLAAKETAQNLAA